VHVSLHADRSTRRQTHAEPPDRSPARGADDRKDRRAGGAIEQGRYYPSLEMAFPIARVFHIPLGEVFHYPDDDH
jgi:hypothetical protein